MASSRELIQALGRMGFNIDRSRGKGSHVRASYVHRGKIVAVTFIPQRQDIPPGTLASIRRSVYVRSSSDFQRLLRGEMLPHEYVELLRAQGIISEPSV